MNRRRGAIAWLIIVLSLLVMSSQRAWGAPSQPSGNVTALDAGGHLLAANPDLFPGAHVTVVATGYAPGVAVAVRPPGAEVQIVIANGGGVVRFAYVVPSGLPNGSYLISLEGAGPGSSAPTTPAAGDGDQQVIVAHIPLVGLFPFRIESPGQSVSTMPTSRPTTGPVSAGHTSTSGGAVVGGEAAGGSGGLSYTGVDILGMVLGGLLAVGLGTLVVLAGRRRRDAGHAGPAQSGGA